MESRILLRDDLSLAFVSPTKMMIGDSGEQDFNRTKALSTLGSKIKLIVDMLSTCSGTRVNGRVYPSAEIRKALPTWTHPFPRPFLERHPSMDGGDEPKTLGRIRDAKYFPLLDEPEMAKDWVNPPERTRGSGYVINAVEMTDKTAVEEVIDGRLLTVSVGMRPQQMLCPICLKDWIPSLMKDGEPGCEHRPNQMYDVDNGHFKGKLPFYFVCRGIENDHIAQTFRPAQPYASVQGFRASDKLQGFFVGDSLATTVDHLTLCDEAGHVVRWFGSDTKPSVAPPPTDTEACVLASLEEANLLDSRSEYADGLDVVAIRSAIDKVVASGLYAKHRGALKEKTLGPKGVFPVSTDEEVRASWKFLDRYTGPTKEMIGLKLLASRHEHTYNEQVMSSKAGDIGMTVDFEKLSDEILTKIGDVEDCDDKILKDKLGAELFAKMDWSTLTADTLKEIEAEERESELEGAAAGIIDKVLTTAARKRLPGSAFCGPERSFPAHDAPHVRNGLSRLPQSTRFTAEQKSRIRACLVRKAKKLGVEVGKKGDSEDAKVLVDKNKELEKLLADAQGKINLLTTEIQATSAARDKALGEILENKVSKILDLRVKLEKPDVKGLDEAGKKTFLDSLRKRTVESLNDSLADLEKEMVNQPARAPAAAAVTPVVQPAVQAGAADNANVAPSKPLSNTEKVGLMFGKK